MEDAEHILGFHPLDKASASVEVWHEKVKHVGGLYAVFWNVRQLSTQFFSPGCQFVTISCANRFAFGLDFGPSFKLGAKQSGHQFRGQIAGADIHPGVLIHLPAEESAAVGAFFADDFSPVIEDRVVDQQSAAFTGAHILGLVETLSGQSAEGAQVFALVFGKETMGVIFHDGDVVFLGYGVNDIHLTADASIMHHKDGLSARRNQVFQLSFIQVKGVWPNVDKDWFGSTQHKGIDGGDEGKGWHND